VNFHNERSIGTRKSRPLSGMVWKHDYLTFLILVSGY
jgi:hypothetical protein